MQHVFVKQGNLVQAINRSRKHYASTKRDNGATTSTGSYHRFMFCLVVGNWKRLILHTKTFEFPFPYQYLSLAKIVSKTKRKKNKRVKERMRQFYSLTERRYWTTVFHYFVVYHYDFVITMSQYYLFKCMPHLFIERL